MLYIVVLFKVLDFKYIFTHNFTCSITLLEPKTRTNIGTITQSFYSTPKRRNLSNFRIY